MFTFFIWELDVSVNESLNYKLMIILWIEKLLATNFKTTPFNFSKVTVNHDISDILIVILNIHGCIDTHHMKCKSIELNIYCIKSYKKL
jgi:hypothetical protein